MNRIDLVSRTLISHYNHDLQWNANIDASLRKRVDHRGRKAETANILDQYRREKAVFATEKLQKAMQSLHVDGIATQQTHKVELAQLE